MKTYTYTVGTHFIVPLLYGNYSYLYWNDEDEKALENFIGKLPVDYIMEVPNGNNDPDFAMCEISGEMIQCYQVNFVVFNDSEEKE